MIGRRVWIYKRLIRCYIRTALAPLRARRELAAKFDNLTDPGLLDRIK